MTDTIFESLYTEELYNLTSKISVVMAIPWEKVTEEERLLLAKILGSVKLSLEKVQIIEQPQFNLSTWLEKPKKVICFSPALVEINKYEVVEVEDVTLVLSNPLSLLIPDDASKRKLWLALKQLFLV